MLLLLLLLGVVDGKAEEDDNERCAEWRLHCPELSVDCAIQVDVWAVRSR